MHNLIKLEQIAKECINSGNNQMFIYIESRLSDASVQRLCNDAVFLNRIEILDYLLNKRIDINTLLLTIIFKDNILLLDYYLVTRAVSQTDINNLALVVCPYASQYTLEYLTNYVTNYNEFGLKALVCRKFKVFDRLLSDDRINMDEIYRLAIENNVELDELCTLFTEWKF